jgi:hypothetical protein
MNLIFCSYAYLESYQSTIEDKSMQEKKIDMYLRCCIVSLVSAKMHNSDCDVALITNIALPEPYKSQCDNYGILIIQKEYDSFKFDKTMQWSLAFYKLCALKYAVEALDYERYLMVDSDTFFLSKLADVWKESDSNILLYDTAHKLSSEQMQTMNAEYYALYGKKVLLTQFGGEFVCGNQTLLKVFLDECVSIYTDMQEKNFKTTRGDEFIIAIAAYKYKRIIKNANPYIFRYWTGRFYLVSTNYRYVNILHIPNEKEVGFLYLYRYISKKGVFPKNNRIFSLFGFPSARRPVSKSTFFYIIKRLKIRCKR